VRYDYCATVAQLPEFDEVIDVRSPGEFTLDHIPGAINLPVLDDQERVRVGTLYKQVSPFEARRVGAALVARNIAHHLDGHLEDRPRDWRPLVYCWRGGGRSDAMCDVLRRVGWRAARLDGGYRAYRRVVLDELQRQPSRFRFVAICGRTGSGKSLLLRAIAAQGGQALDLEQLACHRGSVLGEMPNRKQPSQRLFESKLWENLNRFDPNRPVFVESESRKIGNVQIPETLIRAIREANCLRLNASLAQRVGLLELEYQHFLHDPTTLCERLRALCAHHGRAAVEHWTSLLRAGQITLLVEELLRAHYDPAYDRSIERNFPRYAHALAIDVSRLDATELTVLARELIVRVEHSEIHP
jgi:tRNA 2-selenouridine synthase